MRTSLLTCGIQTDVILTEGSGRRQTYMWTWYSSGLERYEAIYKINVISQRLNHQVTRPLSVRLITDYNDYYRTLYVSVLLSYEYRPGTVFYFGVDDNRERDFQGYFRGTGRYYFAKFSYWWRV